MLLLTRNIQNSFSAAKTTYGELSMSVQNPAKPAVQAIPASPVLIAFAIFVLLGGGASVAIRITYAEMAPFWVAASRFGIGALVFWGLAIYKKLPLPKGRALLGAVLFGALTVGLAFLLISWGLVVTPASLSQILLATVPLFTLFLSAAQGVESITARGILGSLLAIGGIAITVAGSPAENISLPHILAILIAAVCMSQGGVLIKKFPPNPPIMTNAIGMTAGAIILATGSLVRGEAWTIPTMASTWIAFIYLVVFVTVISFLFYMFVLVNSTASGTSYGFVLFPLVTMVIASVIAGEQITLNFLFGAMLVLAGVIVGALLPSKTKPDAVEECKDRSGQVLPRCV
jgi:drug/metabolite transporter (DMT)-like permease